MPAMPRERVPDSTLAILLDPYRFIARRCRAHQSPVFEARILLRKTICMSGPDTAELFYDKNRFTRLGAAPLRVQKTLFGQGGVQGLDGASHLQRKQMFMSLMTPAEVVRLAATTNDWWDTYARRWQRVESVVLYDEVRELLTRAVCAWAGVPLNEEEVGRRTHELPALFDYAGNVGPKHWLSHRARARAERWVAATVEDVRAHRYRPAAGTAAHVIAWHREKGELLSPRIAAVELLNALRPPVAVAVYITFIAHALHEHPDWRFGLEDSEDVRNEQFVQEVCRFYPFFPSVIALVPDDFEWCGYRFPRGRRVILDLYGTNHHPQTWDAPETFRPERFQDWKPSAFNFIPQGGGDHYTGHRCAGEWITIELMKTALHWLAARLEYDVPQQDLTSDYRRLPALPRSRFVMRDLSVRA